MVLFIREVYDYNSIFFYGTGKFKFKLDGILFETGFANRDKFYFTDKHFYIIKQSCAIYMEDYGQWGYHPSEVYTLSRYDIFTSGNVIRYMQEINAEFI